VGELGMCSLPEAGLRRVATLSPIRGGLGRVVTWVPRSGWPRASHDLGPLLRAGLGRVVTWVPRSGLASGESWLGSSYIVP
jgi:hypothetical protein